MRRICIGLAGARPPPVGGPHGLVAGSQGRLTSTSQLGSMAADTCSPPLRLTPRARGLGGWGRGRWSAEPKGTRDSQNSWRPAPRLDHLSTHLGVVACKKHGIGNMDFFTFLGNSFCWDPLARCHFSPGQVFSSFSFHGLRLLKTHERAGLGK